VLVAFQSSPYDAAHGSLPYRVRKRVLSAAATYPGKT